jgi:hypothetical protein
MNISAWNRVQGITLQGLDMVLIGLLLELHSELYKGMQEITAQS